MQPWPVHIVDRELVLRPIRYRDRGEWQRLRNQNAAWLQPWEATKPRLGAELGSETGGPISGYLQMIRYFNTEGRKLRSFSLGIWVKTSGKKEKLIGQITLGGIVFGAYRGAHIGYWIAEDYANRGYTTRAVMALTEYAFHELALHRIEINIRPENEASKKVAEKSGYVYEGLRPRYLHIAGDWRDHLTFVRENPHNFN